MLQTSGRNFYLSTETSPKKVSRCKLSSVEELTGFVRRKVLNENLNSESIISQIDTEHLTRCGLSTLLNEVIDE